jgi:RNA polymerase sigma-B factor
MGARARDSRSDTIEAHLPLVRSIARRYVRRGEPFEDLVQAGTVGLIKAVDRYDPDRHPNLEALARPSIEGEIRHHLRDGGRGPHVPRTDRELAGRLRAVAADLTMSLHRDPTPAELAEAAEVDEAEATRALEAMAAAQPVPLDESRAARLRTEAPTDAAEARVLLEAGWDLLDDRERRMLELRYREERSQAEIARELGLSQAHVSRLLRGALDRLRAAVEPTADTAPLVPEPPRPKEPGRNGRLLLRVPRTLHGDLADAAEREGVSLNTYIAGTLAAAVREEDALPAAAPRRSNRLLVLNAIVIALAALAGLALLAQAWLG